MMRFEIGSVIMGMWRLPGRFLDTWDHTLVRKLTETDTAQIEISHIAVLTATAETTTNYTRCKLRRALRSNDD